VAQENRGATVTKKRTFTIESNLGGVSGQYEDSALGPIRAGLNQLIDIKRRGSSPNPKELAWEIRLYEWILNQPDAESKAAMYLKRRMPIGTPDIIPKRRVVESLGWNVQ
jgi:hypothetical protein